MIPIKIALFGATGGTGLQFCQQALAAGHQITALVRDSARLTLTHEKLHIIEGNVLDPDAVLATVRGAEAVVCSLGNTANNPEGVVTAGTQHIIAAMKQEGVKRLLVVTSLGVGDSIDQVPLAFKLIMKTALRKAIADKESQETAVRESSLDWTIIRPGGLTDDPMTGQYQAGIEKRIRAGRIARADVAHFMLAVLEQSLFIRQAPAITG